MQITDTENPSNVLDTLIVGAGIRGMSLAHAMQARQSPTGSRPARFYEQKVRDEWEGGLSPPPARGFSKEEGPNSFSPAPALLKLAVDVGLKPLPHPAQAGC